MCQEAFQLSNGALELSIFTLSLKNATHKLIFYSLKLFQQAYQLSYSAFRFRRNVGTPGRITFRLPTTSCCLSSKDPLSKQAPTRQRNPLPETKKRAWSIWSNSFLKTPNDVYFIRLSSILPNQKKTPQKAQKSHKCFYKIRT